MFESDTESEGSIDTVTDTNLELDNNQGDSEQNDSGSEAGDEIQQDAPKPSSPFATGKEKFKVNGEELEWDWETTRRYAQMGRSGQVALERAAKIEEQAKNAYNQLLDAAKNDPEGLLELLNPGYKSSLSKQRDAGGAGLDPRDQRIQQLEAQVAKFNSHLETQEVEAARAEINKELDTALNKFPGINDEIHRDYIKSQYRKYLTQGVTDISIEDIAFQVSQKIQEQKNKANAQRKTAMEQKIKNAPAVGMAGGSGVGDRKDQESGIEYAKRLAGLV